MGDLTQEDYERLLELAKECDKLNIHGSGKTIKIPYESNLFDCNEKKKGEEK